MKTANAPGSLENFGGNIHFTPRQIYAPHSEADVLDILNHHARGHIRPVGRLNSWSDVIAAGDVLVSMHHFTRIHIETAPDGAVIAEVGAGVTLQSLLPVLREAGVTLPTLPATLVQTLVGCVCTATHGSGAPSLSHFVVSARMAAYDPTTGLAAIYEWEDGPELRAARCSLGYMGIILSVKIRCVPDYSVLLKIERCHTIDEVLAQEKSFPLQDFVLEPFAWDYIVFRRRPLRLRPGAENRLPARLYRAYKRVVQDTLAHLVLKLFLSFQTSAPLRWYLRSPVPALLLPGVEVVDSSQHSLTRRHDLYRHVEMELYVPASHLRAALHLTQELLMVLSGEKDAVSPESAVSLDEIRLLEPLRRLGGSYIHHYPVYVRRVLPEDTLISMTGNAQEAYYTLSFFNYKPGETFYAAARYLAQVFNTMYGAFPHWGKHFPLWNADIEMLFPELEQFRGICHALDPDGVLHNDFARRVLGFASRVAESAGPYDAP